MVFNPWWNRTKSQSGKSQVSGKWKLEKTQEMPKTKVGQFLKEERDVDGKENGDRIQNFQVFFPSVEKGNNESNEKSMFRAQETDSAKQLLGK